MYCIVVNFQVSKISYICNGYICLNFLGDVFLAKKEAKTINPQNKNETSDDPDVI